MLGVVMEKTCREYKVLLVTFLTFLTLSAAALLRMSALKGRGYMFLCPSHIVTVDVGTIRYVVTITMVVKEVKHFLAVR